MYPRNPSEPSTSRPVRSRPRRMETCEGLQRGVETQSVLENVVWEPPEAVVSRVEQHQSNVVPNATFLMLNYPTTIPDARRFEVIVEDRKLETKRDPWEEYLKHTLVFHLGPEEIIMYQERHPEIRYRNFMLYTMHAIPAYLLFVERMNNDKECVEFTEEALGRNRFLHDSRLVPVANGVVELRYGRRPELIRDRMDVKNLLVFEDVPLEEPPRTHYERVLNCRIKSHRKLTSLEVEWLERKLERNDLCERQIRLIEFHRLRNRDNAERTLATLPFLFCDSAINPEEIGEEVLLHVTYPTRLKAPLGVRLKVAKEEDWQYTINLLKTYRRKKYEGEYQGHTLTVQKLVKENELCIQFSYSGLWHYDDMTWFIRKTCEKNDIEIESIFPNGRSTVAVTVEELLDRKNRIYTILDEKLTDLRIDDGLDGPRTEKCSWHIEETSEVAAYLVEFDEPEAAVRILKMAINKDYNPFGITVRSLFVDPEMTPVFRQYYRISRRLRAVFATVIRDLDKKFREQFVKDSQVESQSMKTRESYYFSLRIYEDWVEEEDSGLIGVEGWSPELVKQRFRELRQHLLPMQISREARPELFFGIGESFALSLVYKYQVAVDVDKFQDMLNIYGDDAATAYRDLMNYEEMKRLVQVEVEMPVSWPFLNCEGVLDEDTIARFASTLGARIESQNAHRIWFQGTIEAFESLNAGLEEISAEVIDDHLKNWGQATNFHCPVCQTSKIQGDYFRLNCGHVYCRQCANETVKGWFVPEETKMNCSEPECKGLWRASEIMDLIVGGSRRMKELDVAKIRRLEWAAIL